MQSYISNDTRYQTALLGFLIGFTCLPDHSNWRTVLVRSFSCRPSSSGIIIKYSCLDEPLSPQLSGVTGYKILNNYHVMVRAPVSLSSSEVKFTMNHGLNKWHPWLDRKNNQQQHLEQHFQSSKSHHSSVWSIDTLFNHAYCRVNDGQEHFHCFTRKQPFLTLKTRHYFKPCLVANIYDVRIALRWICYQSHKTNIPLFISCLILH